jgi:hypothetical protein
MGDKLGLYRALADGGPLTPADLPPALGSRSATRGNG